MSGPKHKRFFLRTIVLSTFTFYLKKKKRTYKILDILIQQLTFQSEDNCRGRDDSGWDCPREAPSACKKCSTRGALGVLNEGTAHPIRGAGV